MKTTDLFKNNRSSKKINESIEKAFGKKLNLESFNLEQLQDARNKLRTQIHDARSQSGFNENLENDALTQAQWMLDAINAEIAEREEFVVDASTAEASYEEGADSLEGQVAKLLDQFERTAMEMGAYGSPDIAEIIQHLKNGDAEAAAEEVWYSYADQDGGEVPQIEGIVDDLQAEFEGLIDSDEGGETDDNYAMASAGFGSDEDYGEFPESAPPGDKAERMVKHIKKGYAKDGKLTDKEKSIAYATAWKQHNKEKNESVDEADELARREKTFAKSHLADKNNASEYKQKDNPRYKGQYKIAGPKGKLPENKQGEDMTKLNEGEIQQASAIVTAKTMVDRVGRWIEELSGMENETLLQLGDSIRDEMGSEQAKNFISAVAPAIQAALENLKQTRETLATGVRTLTGEEQGAEMLGADPAAAAGDELGAAPPDEMNMPAEEPGAPEDEFAAAEPAAGGLGDAGREQRESINYQNRLLKVLAG